MDDEHHRPGEPPEVRDEAADTPLWVPAFGLALLIVGAVLVVWQSSGDEKVGEALEDAVEQAIDGDDGGGPTDEGQPGEAAGDAPSAVR